LVIEQMMQKAEERMLLRFLLIHHLLLVPIRWMSFLNWMPRNFP
jgi:hypothetical protein